MGSPMSNSAFDPRHVAGDQSSFHSPPPNPVAELRACLVKMQDCIGRMNDATAVDLLSQRELSYINRQLTHLGNAYVKAAAIVTSVSMCAMMAQENFDEWEEGEIESLTLPTPPASDVGGGA